MSHLLSYVIPGIADGSVYALTALGLVLTYKTAGIFNFSHGALAATAAYVFYEFRVKDHLPWPVAFLLALIIVGGIGGLLLERLAFALTGVPAVSTVVATVGVLVALQSLDTAIYGSADILFREFLPQSGFRLAGYKVTIADLIILAISLGAAAALFYFFGATRNGKAMTAVVDDPRLLSLMGTNPAVVRRFAWVMGSCFASVSGMLLAPRLGVSVNTLILLVIAAYGAAAVGLFDNLALVVAGGFAIGQLVDVLPLFTDRSKSIIVQLLPRNLPFLVLFAALIVVPARKFPLRGVRNVRRFRPVRQFSRPVMAGGMTGSAALLIAVPFLINNADITQYAAGMGYLIIFASLGLITWTSGQISLCQLGFAAIGATTTGHLLAHHVPWPIAVLVAGLITIPAGAIVALPAIRLSGIYVAIATFGFGILLQQIFYPSFLMFGVLNRVVVPRPKILGIDFTGDRAYYYLALITVGVVAALIVVVLRSRLGLLLRALSDSPDALDAHGTNTNLTKVLVFCIASFIAGVGGAVISGVPQSASGSAGGTFDFTVSLVFVAVLGFAGRRPLLSPLIAAFAYEVVKIYPPFNSQTFIKYEGVLFGGLAIFTAIAPGLSIRARGERAGQRDGRSPLASRADASPTASAIQPKRRAPRPSVGVAGAAAVRPPAATGALRRHDPVRVPDLAARS